MSANLITRTLENAHGSAGMNNELRQSIIKWVDKSKIPKFEDVPLVGKSETQRVCIGQEYDETRPRIRHTPRFATHAVSGYDMRDDHFAIVTNTIESLGALIGREVNHHCGSCQHAETTMYSQHSYENDLTNVRAKFECKLPGNQSVCPDAYSNVTASTGGISPPRHFDMDHIIDEYGYLVQGTDLANHGTTNKYSNEYLRESFEPAKTKETIKDADIEIEILKLDERYGMF